MIGFVCDSENATSQGYLAHHGVDNMQWGVRNGPPYPLNRQGRAALRKQRKQQKKYEKQKAKEAKLREIEHKKEEKLKKEKDKLIRSASAQEIMQYKGYFSNNELEYIVNRLRLEEDLARYANKNQKTVMDYISNMGKHAGSLSKAGNNFINLYNTMANVYNAKVSSEKSKGQGKHSDYLPIVGGGKKDKND